MLLLRLCWLVTIVITAVLVLGAFAALGYQETTWLRHNYWPDLRFVRLWGWVKIDPSPIGRLVGSRNLAWILQLPLWAGLMTPGIIFGFIAAKLARWTRRTVDTR